MAKVCILKKNGETLKVEIKETVLQAWAILHGMKIPDAIAEISEDVSEQMYETRMSWNVRRNPIFDYVIFKNLKGNNILFNKRFIAWIEE